MTASRLRQLVYSITSSLLCQVLFLIFFKIFFAPASLRSPPAPALSPLSGGFLRALLPSLCDSFAILSLHSSIVNPFFPLFSCLVILLYSARWLLTNVKKVIPLFSTVITSCISIPSIITFCISVLI